MDKARPSNRQERRADAKITRQQQATTFAPDEVYLTEAQLAARRQLSIQKLRKDRAAGIGCPWTKFGRAVRYALSDVLAEEARSRLAEQKAATADPASMHS